MRPELKMLIFVCLSLTGFNSFSQHIPEKTLLWRIEGKNITAPSYIYGTMHLYDQRLFNFGDSVYRALESSKGFANEIDPAIFIDSMFAEKTADTSTLLKDMVDEKKYKEIAKKLKEKLGIEEDELTNKKIAAKRSSWYYNLRSKDDMNAIVDFYLYDVARKTGKITGGVEDYIDQKDLSDEMGNALDIEKFSNENPESWKKNLDKFIDLYVKQEVEMMYQLSSDKKSANNSKKILDNRNIKMIINIDSLINIRSTFFAVGAAHLAGDKGLINLMRARGYRMVPVYSSKRLHAKKYVFEEIPLVWETISVADKSYTVEMPGKASDIKLSEEVPTFKMYADMGSTTFYMTTAMPTLNDDKDAEVLLSKAAERFIDGAKQTKVTSKRFLYKGQPAIEIMSLKDNIFFKMNLVLKESRLYLLLIGAQKKMLLTNPDADRFLQSLQINESFKEVSKPWHPYNNPELALALDFPNKPQFKMEELDTESAKTWEIATYSTSDFATGGYYSLINLSAKPGFLITNDTVILKSKIDVFANRDLKVLNQEYYQWNGYPAMRYSAKLKDETTTYFLIVVTVNRINRNFTAMAVVPDNEKAVTDAERFIKSFTILPFDTASWQTQILPGNVGSAWGPATFVSENTDSSTTTKPEEGRVDFMIDKNNSINYSINVSGFRPYFFRPNEDSLLRETAATFFSDTSSSFRENYGPGLDSMIYSKKITNGTANGMEILVKQPASHNYKKIRIFINGDSLYKLIVFAPLQDLNKSNSRKFFEDFRFTKPNLKGNLFINRTADIVAALSSPDSITRETARDALDETIFSKSDLPMLHNALLVSYPIDTLSYYTITDMLEDKISAQKDISSADFIEKEYGNVVAFKDNRAINMLEILADNNTTRTYNLLKKLWLSSPPQVVKAYSFGSNLYDSLQLAASLFPEFQKLYTDTISAGFAITVAAQLLDSNSINKESILSNAAGLYEYANRDIKNYYKKDYYNSSTYPLLKLLAGLNTNESIALLKDFTKQPDLDVNLEAVTRLLEKEIEVDNSVLLKLAANINQRIMLYDALDKSKKLEIFPKKYHNQLSFAESQLAYAVGDDEIYAAKTDLLFTHKINYKGWSQLYYCFKITDTEGENYLAFVGPYKKGQLQVPYAELRYQALYDVPFSKSSVNQAFELFIKENPAE